MSRAKQASVSKSHRHFKLCAVTLSSPEDICVGNPEQACIQIINNNNNNKNGKNKASHDTTRSRIETSLRHGDHIVEVEGFPCLGLGAAEVAKLIQIQTCFPIQLRVFRYPTDPSSSGSATNEIKMPKQALSSQRTGLLGFGTRVPATVSRRQNERETANADGSANTRNKNEADLTDLRSGSQTQEPISMLDADCQRNKTRQDLSTSDGGRGGGQETKSSVAVGNATRQISDTVRLAESLDAGVDVERRDFSSVRGGTGVGAIDTDADATADVTGTGASSCASRNITVQEDDNESATVGAVEHNNDTKDVQVVDTGVDIEVHANTLPATTTRVSDSTRSNTSSPNTVVEQSVVDADIMSASVARRWERVLGRVNEVAKVTSWQRYCSCTGGRDRRLAGRLTMVDDLRFFHFDMLAHEARMIASPSWLRTSNRSGGTFHAQVLDGSTTTAVATDVAKDNGSIQTQPSGGGANRSSFGAFLSRGISSASLYNSTKPIAAASTTAAAGMQEELNIRVLYSMVEFDTPMHLWFDWILDVYEQNRISKDKDFAASYAEELAKQNINFEASEERASAIDQEKGEILVEKNLNHSNAAGQPWCGHCGFPDRGFYTAYHDALRFHFQMLVQSARINLEHNGFPDGSECDPECFNNIKIESMFKRAYLERVPIEWWGNWVVSQFQKVYSRWRVVGQ